MKQLFTLVLTLAAIVCITFHAAAQQEALYAQYTHLPFLYNPGVAGSSEKSELRFFHRWQWVSFPGAPVTFGLNYHSGYKNNGYGGEVYMDQTGPTRRWGASLAYAYQLPIDSKGTKLGIGLAGRFLRFEVNTKDIHFNDPSDQIAQAGSIGRNKGEASLGLYLHNPKYFVSLSSLNLMQTQLDLSSLPGTSADVARYYRHYFLSAGYNITTTNVTYMPNFLLKTTANTPLQWEVGTRVKFDKHDFGIGAAYRSSGFLAFSFNTILDHQFPIVIGFDISTTPFSNYSTFAYELMGGADFARRDLAPNYITAPPPVEGK